MKNEEPHVSVQSPSIRAQVESILGDKVVGPPELIQELWSGYGRIERLSVGTPGGRTVILKAVDPLRAGRDHPRGWGTDRSHARKLRSYEVERTFYESMAGRLAGGARVPRYHGGMISGHGSVMLMEDLDAAGFAGRKQAVTEQELRACLDWLASFHATFLGAPTAGLWDRGTYWHLATRPDELAATEDQELVRAAPGIDARLGDARYRTLVHGDAKLANFCFPSALGGGVAAVDFQYVGGGVGVQDVAYFLGSCLEDDELERRASTELDYYIHSLRTELGARASAVAAPTDGPIHGPTDARAVEAEWRELWPFAWADFHRFLAGWSPGHWKLSRYSDEMLRRALSVT
ncbi:MAG: hypothetical protein ACJA2W_002320 [Planctomycetota bacterium]|jgi:hypothetical protein